VDKVKMSDDHSMAAFTVDVGNQEKIVGGVRDLTTGEILPKLKLEGISAVEFGKDNSTLYVVKTDEFKRPFKVVKLDLKSKKEESVFVEKDPANYVDIGKSKDGKYLIINSATKEESEVWVLDRDGDSIAPELLIQRTSDIRAYVDHLRDFFIVITN